MRKKFLLRAFLVCIVGVVTFMRLMMSFSLRMWYNPGQTYDDFVPVLQAVYSKQESTQLLLSKNPGYSYWGRLLESLGINADVGQFLVWFAAAILISLMLHCLFHKLWVSLLGYIYVLWNPIAFESWLGTRLYRNSLFAPCLFILIALFLIILNYKTPLVGSVENAEMTSSKSVGAILSYLLLCVATGCLVTYIYLLKEDSIWILPLFIFVIVYKLFLFARTFGHRSLTVNMCYVMITVLMAGVAVAGLQLVSYSNRMNYGVGLLNTRTEGEVAGFVERVYQIDSDGQTPDIWAPEDSIRQVFDVSPTLNSIPGLRYGILHKGFAAPDIKVNPLKGDFLGWQVRTVMEESGQWKNESKIQKTFKQVNSEIDSAFNDGRLKKTKKYAVVKSMVPRTPQQIMALFKPSIKAMYWTVDSRRVYSVENHLNSDSSDWENQAGLKLYGINSQKPNEPRIPSFPVEVARRVALLISKVYLIINFVLILILVGAVAGVCLGKFKPTFMLARMYVFIVLMMLYGWVYCFTISWFAEFLHADYVLYFYTNGSALPFVQTALLIGGGLMVYCCTQNRKIRSTNK